MTKGGTIDLGLSFDGMPEAYPYLRDMILSAGHRVSPRGEPTVELLGVGFTVLDAVNRGVPVGCGRKVGVKMQAIDGTGNLAGASYPDVAIRLSPSMERFADRVPHPVSRTEAYGPLYDRANAPESQPFFQGAYGPRIGDQLELAETALRRDPETRQAVVNLWDPRTDTQPWWKDRPCTTQFQLMVREDARGEDELHIFVEMRANDLWTGTCYDVWQFGQVQAAMAHVLGIKPGPYHHYATSLHIYERDVEKFGRVQPWRKNWVHDPVMASATGDDRAVVLGEPALVPAVENPRESFGPDWAGLEPGTYPNWSSVRAAFVDMLESARRDIDFEPTNEVEQWYWDILSTIAPR